MPSLFTFSLKQTFIATRVAMLALPYVVPVQSTTDFVIYLVVAKNMTKLEYIPKSVELT